MPSGPGVSETDIAIGVDYIEGGEEAFESLGIPLAIGDTRAQAQAVIDSINAAGGIAGRQLVSIGHARQADPSKTTDQLEQEACTTFTEDNAVLAVVSIAAHFEIYPRCLAAAGTSLMADSTWVDEQLNAEVIDHVYLPSYWASDELLGIELERLIATGWLTTDSVIGAFYYENPVVERLYNNVVVPTLAAHGMALTQTVVATPEGQFQQFAAATLQFRGAGIDKVLSVMYSPLAFMLQAESQNYRPGWSVNTAYGPGGTLQSTAPKGQLANAAGIGWAPAADVDPARNPGPVSANETRCLDIMEAADQDVSAASTRVFALQICDYFFLLEAALPVAPALTGPGLAEGAASLGDTLPSPIGFATNFVRGRPGGGAAIRDLRYFTDCSCFNYSSDPIRVR